MSFRHKYKQNSKSQKAQSLYKTLKDFNQQPAPSLTPGRLLIKWDQQNQGQRQGELTSYRQQKPAENSSPDPGGDPPETGAPADWTPRPTGDRGSLLPTGEPERQRERIPSAPAGRRSHRSGTPAAADARPIRPATGRRVRDHRANNPGPRNRPSRGPGPKQYKQTHPKREEAKQWQKET